MSDADEALRLHLLEVMERQAAAHGVDITEGPARGMARNILAVVLGEWCYEREELERLRAFHVRIAEIAKEVQHFRPSWAELGMTCIGVEIAKLERWREDRAKIEVGTNAAVDGTARRSLDEGSRDSGAVLNAFDEAWEALEREGVCDGYGGAEYRRVRGAWMRDSTARNSLNVRAFIRLVANSLPPQLAGLVLDREGR